MKRQQKDTEIVPSNKSSTSTVPAYIQGGNAEGFENVEPMDIVIPRIKLMQALSPEVIDGRAKPGEMINALSGKKYPASIEFIPIMHNKTRAFWQDRDKGNGVLCSSINGKTPVDSNAPVKLAKQMKLADFPKCINSCMECPFSKFDENEDDDRKRRPKCTMYHNFPIMIVGEKMPSALSMSRTKLKVGQKLLSLAMLAGNAVPIYSMHYKLSTILEKKNNNTYHNFVIEPTGWSTEDEYKLTSGLNKSYKNLNVKVSVDHPDEDGTKE